MSMLAALQAAFESVPFNRHAGLHLVHVAPERAEVSLDPTPDFTQEHGVVHGGMLAALADTAAVYLVQPYLKEGERMASIEFKVNFLKPVWPGTATLRAVAKPVRIGRRVAVCETAIWQEDEVILTGLFTYMKFASTGAGTAPAPGSGASSTGP